METNAELGKAEIATGCRGVNTVFTSFFYDRGNFRRGAARHETPPPALLSKHLHRPSKQVVPDTCFIYGNIPAAH